NLHSVNTTLNDDKSWMAVWKMTEFVHGNYDQKITIEDIATYGAVCRSRCCELFGKYIGQTPNNYLKQFRIKKSCIMLSETNMSITEIALACGFQTASYFTYVFRKEMGVTPQDYRKC
ncbi:MAG: helix-turn-helix domain-containing protein, partial [Peptostreptococcaceae bacterium]